MTLINPYNFVPLKDSGSEQEKWANIHKHNRLHENTYSGHLILRFRTITPIFIPSRQLKDIIIVNDPNGRPIRTFKHFHNNGENPTIPGTSIKGMIRSVLETLTNSCMSLFAETYSSNTYKATNHKHEECNLKSGLCPACSVFGTILSDELHLQGKVRFSDAVGEKEDILPGVWILKELSSPKPESHTPFYAKDGSVPAGPRGRKFYFHHAPSKILEDDYLTQADHNHRNVKILEVLKQGAQLIGRVDFQGLTEEELAYLLYALELEYIIEEQNDKRNIKRILAHKIGMGKPLGLGSIGIWITKGSIEEGSERYRPVEGKERIALRNKIEILRELVVKPSAEFNDLFSLNKHAQGDIQYPGKEWFEENKKKQLGTYGEFEGMLLQPEVVSKSPSYKILSLDPGEIKQGEVESIEENKVIIKTDDELQYQCEKKSFQGMKDSEIFVGKRVSLRGKAVYPFGKTPK